jgi:hypothetical protein
MKLMSVVLLAVATLVFPGAIAPSQAQTKWTLFQPSGDGFIVECPGTPTVTRDTLPSNAGPAPHVSAELSYKGSMYTVELTTYASASPPEAVLDLFAGAIAKAGKVRSQTPLKVGADAARLVTTEMQGGKVIVTSLLVTDGTRVYHVQCTTLQGQENSASAKRFIHSFRLAAP